MPKLDLKIKIDKFTFKEDLSATSLISLSVIPMNARIMVGNIIDEYINFGSPIKNKNVFDAIMTGSSYSYLVLPYKSELIPKLKAELDKHLLRLLNENYGDKFSPISVTIN